MATLRAISIAYELHFGKLQLAKLAQRAQNEILR